MSPPKHVEGSAIALQPQSSINYCNQFPERGTVKQVSNGYVVAIKGARLFHSGTAHHVITRDNYLLTDLSNPEQPDLDLLKSAPVSCFSGTAAVVGSMWGGRNIYHWFYDSIPRSGIYQDLEYFDQIDAFVVNKPVLPVIESLAAHLSLPAKKTVSLEHRVQVFQPDVLVVAFSKCGPRKWKCEFLKNQFGHLIKKPESGWEKLFIGRKQAWIRRLVNIHHWNRIAEANGFRCVELESLSASEQLSIFAYAHKIIAVHGAGLAHLGFCRPETRVVELFNPHFVTDLYQRLSSEAGLHYRSVIGGHSNERLKTDDPREFDVSVERSQLEAAFQF